MRRAVAFLALVAASCTTMEPHYVRPDAAIPASWPTGDAYLRQSEATLPAVTYRAIFREFAGGATNPEDVGGSGDVKYHLGASSDR